MRKILFFAILAFAMLLVEPKPAQAFFGSFNPCDNCKFFLRYCCPGKCPTIDIRNIAYQALRRLRHRDRMEILGKWRETRINFVRIVGHEGKRISTGTKIESTRAVPRFAGHDVLTYGVPEPDIWLQSIPSEHSGKKITCQNRGKDIPGSHLKTSTIADASAALPNLGIALGNAEQNVAAALRGAGESSDLRDITLRIADITNARLQIRSVSVTSQALRSQISSAVYLDRYVPPSDETSNICED